MALLVADVFRRAAASTPARPAVTLGARSLSFGDLDSAGNRMAHVLRGAGIGRGDRVGWWGGITLDAVALFVALAKLGAVFVPLNSGLGPDEAAPILARARSAMLVVDSEHAESGEALALGCGRDSGLSTANLGPSPGPGVDLGTATDAPRRGAAASDATDPELSEGDPHVIFFTSGSTGAPKGVVLSNRANVLRTFPPNATMSPGPTVCMFPLFHMASWTLALGCWQARQELVLVERADAPSLLGAVEARRARRIYLIPAVWDRVLSELATPSRRWDTSSLAEADTGTSATPPELLARVRAALPSTTTRVMYGSTEAGPGTSLAPEDVERKPGSVGLPSPVVDLRLSGAGEILLRSDLLMDGYFEDPVATSEALADRWYHTGDLGTLDEEGYLYVVGRARDVIRTGGESVSPTEVEAVLASVDGVAEVAVVGVPDERWGEIVCAVVVAGETPPPDLGGMRRACEGRLASFKHPRRLEVVEALPRTGATGQVQRSLLIERLRLDRRRPDRPT